MRHMIVSRLFLAVSFAVISAGAHAADQAPVGRKIDNAQIMERVQLVGVIAGGSAADSGVAVIKDAQSGRTYAIKTGDSLPGVSHVILRKVRRELAIFMADGKEFHVRLSVGGYTQEAEDEEDLAADLNKSEGPGLFEKWRGSKVGVGADLVEDRPGVVVDSKNTAESKPMIYDLSNGSNAPVVQESVEPDEVSVLREDRDGAVHDYLDSLTTPSVSKKSGARHQNQRENDQGQDVAKDSARDFLNERLIDVRAEDPQLDDGE